MTNLTSSYNLSVGNSLIIAGEIQQNQSTSNVLGNISSPQINTDNLTTEEITTNDITILNDATVNNLTINGLTTLLNNVDLTLYDTTFYDINLNNSINFTLNGIDYTLSLTELKKIFNSASTSYVDTSIATAINNLLGPDLDVSYDTLKEIQLILQENEANITTLLSSISLKTTLTEIQGHENIFTNENTFNNNVFINNSNLVVNGLNVKTQLDTNTNSILTIVKILLLLLLLINK
jgi:hypothetical protein